MFFVATKMGPHCKEMQNHGKQRCIKMTHFQKNLSNFGLVCCIEKLIGTELLQVFMSFLIDFRISFSDWGFSNFSMKFALQSAKKKAPFNGSV